MASTFPEFVPILMKVSPFIEVLVWIIIAGAFIIWEINGVIWDFRTHNDDETATHFLSLYIPIALRAAILGWLLWHFLVQHKHG